MTEMIGVDVGGTFTDVVGIEAGRILVAKIPTDADRQRHLRAGRGHGGWRRRGLGVQPGQHRRAQRHHHPPGAEDRLPDHTRPPRHPRSGSPRPAHHRPDRHVVAEGDQRRVPAPGSALPAARHPRAADRPRRGAHCPRRGTGPTRAAHPATLRRGGRRHLPAERLCRWRPRTASAPTRRRGARRAALLDLERGLAIGQGVRPRLDDGGRHGHEGEVRRVHRASRARACDPLASAGGSTSPTARPGCCRRTTPWSGPTASSSAVRRPEP